MHQPRFFQKFASCVFFLLADEPPCPLQFGDIFAGLNGGRLAGNGADRNHNSKLVLASSSGRCKKFCHIACMKQPSVRWSPFFRLEQKRKPWLGERAFWASVFTGCLKKGSKLQLRAFRPLWDFPVIIDRKMEGKEVNLKKKEEEEIKYYNFKKREEKKTEKKRHNIIDLAT